MNLFASDEFLRALGRAAFPNRPSEPAHFQVGDHTFRMLLLEGRQPVVAFPFLDFHEPVQASGVEVRLLDYVPFACTSRIEAAQWDPSQETPDFQPSPLIDWSRFATWEAYEAHMNAAKHNFVPDTRRRRRNLERDLGKIEFTWDDTGADAFDTCLQWKSRQYVATGLRDQFADPRHVALFRELRTEGVLRVATLRAGGVLVAAHVGALLNGRFYYWISAYDPAFSRYAPGRILLIEMLSRSFHDKHVEFDLLIGSEAYKWQYATHARIVAPVGTMPLTLRARRVAKSAVKSTLQRVPWLWAQTEGLRRRMR